MLHCLQTQGGLSVLALLLITVQETTTHDPFLLPQPQELTFLPVEDAAGVSLERVRVCFYPLSETPRLRSAAIRWLASAGHADDAVDSSECERLGRDDHVSVEAKTWVSLRVVVEGEVPDLDPLPPTGYTLQVLDREIRLVSRSEEGLYYALATLTQLTMVKDRPVRPLHIRDWPVLPNRGVMLDVSRNRVPTIATLRRLVALYSSLKLNQLQLYTEHTFAYAGFERVWNGTGALTAADIRALEAFCHHHFVQLVPNQQSFGHMQHWLKRDDLRGLAESPEGQARLFAGDYCCSMWNDPPLTPYSLAPDQASLDFLSSLYDQLLPLFPHASAVNVGLDETFDLGSGKSRDAVARLGARGVYLDFLHRLHQRVGTHGMALMFWGDIVAADADPAVRAHIPAGAVVMEWGYEAHHDFATRARWYHEGGVRYYLCPGAPPPRSIRPTSVLPARPSEIDICPSAPSVDQRLDRPPQQEWPACCPTEHLTPALSHTHPRAVAHRYLRLADAGRADRQHAGQRLPRRTGGSRPRCGGSPRYRSLTRSLAVCLSVRFFS